MATLYNPTVSKLSLKSVYAAHSFALAERGTRVVESPGMDRKIPAAAIAVVSDALAQRYSHAQIDHFMESAGIELSPLPLGNRQVKTRAWLLPTLSQEAPPGLFWLQIKGASPAGPF
jgi:hypothetical protein